MQGVSRRGRAHDPAKKTALSLKNSLFAGNLPRRPARSALRRQPPIHALGQAPRETQEWAENPGFSHIRSCLRTPGWPMLRWKSAKVSGLVRKYSRFAETNGRRPVRSRLPPDRTRNSNPARSASQIWGAVPLGRLGPKSPADFADVFVRENLVGGFSCSR